MLLLFFSFFVVAARGRPVTTGKWTKTNNRTRSDRTCGMRERAGDSFREEDCWTQQGISKFGSFNDGIWRFPAHFWSGNEKHCVV